jgi:hypothetical protein
MDNQKVVISGSFMAPTIAKRNSVLEYAAANVTTENDLTTETEDHLLA